MEFIFILVVAPAVVAMFTKPADPEEVRNGIRNFMN